MYFLLMRSDVRPAVGSEKEEHGEVVSCKAVNCNPSKSTSVIA